MKACAYIIVKQVAWAQNNGVSLIGSKIDGGGPAYTRCLEANLFESLLSQTIQEFEAGDGHELSGYPPKMSALHSSSALAVNFFQYWQRVGVVGTINPVDIRFDTFTLRSS